MTKSRRKQSAADRQNRVNNGCCPIHGIGMTQIAHNASQPSAPFVVSCPRCGISGKTDSSDSAVILDAEFIHLLNGE